MRPRTLTLLLLLLGLALAGCGERAREDAAVREASPGTDAAAQRGQAERPPRMAAVLINGGFSRRLNYQSHLLQLRELYEYLLAQGIPRRRIWIFSGDGENPAPDLAVRDLQPEKGFWLIEGTALGQNLRSEIRYENSRLDGRRLLPAKRRKLMRWAQRGAHRHLRAGDTLLVYVTDHGQLNRANPRNNWINLWGDRLSVEEFRRWLAALPEGVRVVSLMSQCYSGAFANAIYDLEDPALVSGEFCGYFSSSAERPAYGCYPENRGKDGVGHSARFFEALRLHGNLAAAHERVLITDRTPDVPNRSSDHYLRELLGSAADAHDMDLDRLVDDLLGQVAPDDPEARALFAQIDHIGHAFGSFAPRSLAELEAKARNLPRLEQELGSYARRWSAALTDLRRENLEAFLEVFPDYRPYRDRERTEALPHEERQRLTAALLRDLETYTDRQPARKRRLEALHGIAQRASDASYRMAVRRAVVLRLRALLTRSAGLFYLERYADAQARREFEGLRVCEDYSFGSARAAGSGAPELPPPYPRLEAEDALLADVLPGWIGIQFRVVSAAEREARDLARGAVRVLRVFPDSPAAVAGLRSDDLILGPPGRPFDEPREIREWVMTSIVGEKRAVEVLRDDERLILTVQIGRAPV